MMLVIGEVLVPKAQAEYALHHELARRVLDASGVAVITKAGREALDDPHLLLDFGQQDRSPVRGDRPAVETAHDLAPTKVFDLESALATLCSHSRLAGSVP